MVLKNFIKIILFTIIVLFIVIKPFYLSSGLETYEKEIKADFYISETYSVLNKTLKQVTVLNEALLRLFIKIYGNSTNSVNIFIEPQSEWNFTPQRLYPNDSINVTLTNGFLDLDPDVASMLWVILCRDNVSDRIWGSYFIGILTKGYYKTPWPFWVPLFTLVLLTKRLKLGTHQ
ncbi:MAG: hypothetical protein ACTSR2_10110 [Candidatus Hodarchaeales archaeon]